MTTTMLTVEPPIKDPLRKGQPSGHLSHSSSSFLTSEKRTTFRQRTKWQVPRCVLNSEVPLYDARA